MAKRLTKEQKKRASICFECGFIPSKEAWSNICLKQGEDYETVRYMADQFDISDDDMVTIECLQSKEELHVVADHYNWDDEGVESLYAILNHPHCDAGTGLLLFWKGSGYSALSPNPGFATQDEIVFFKEVYDRFVNKKFNTYDIAFDAYYEMYVPSLEEYLENSYVVPAEFLCPYSKMYVQDCL
ncbi:DUF4274 domain-containing protein [Vibrio vulnificus]|nr:DUF4274 domain-containing protein [Vibrio vulnificus]EIZ4669991.1 DUF4274 domain-containing protein [Vibrio vulnificus]HDY7695078.1 DUF4274 domain-containing protein [Vibrio vulnificus]HDY7809494.1 DUF4274 domain-containing protein [Vibrio vulnificus]